MKTYIDAGTTWTKILKIERKSNSKDIEKVITSTLFIDSCVSLVSVKIRSTK